MGALPPRRFLARVRPSSWWRLSVACAAAVLAAAAFVQVVHAGSLVDAGDGIRFRSRYSGAKLARLAEDRAARWAVAPPPAALVRFSREDQYLAEGVWHVQERNAAWESDIRRAWRENQILERYFPAVLDTPTYAIPERSRWPDAQREDARRRGGGPAAGWTSRADPIPILVLSPAWIWAPVGVLATVLLGLGTAARRRPDPLIH